MSSEFWWAVPTLQLIHAHTSVGMPPGFGKGGQAAHGTRLRYWGVAAIGNCSRHCKVSIRSVVVNTPQSRPSSRTGESSACRSEHLTAQQFCCILPVMPETEVVYYREDDRSVPVLDWLTQIAHRNRKVAVKFAARLDVLREFGHELRRPVADYLRDGIYELRVRTGRVNYRILYFFFGRGVVVLTSGLTKEKEVPATEIERALSRKGAFEKDPDHHTYREEISDG